MKFTLVVRNKSSVAADGPTPTINRHVTLTPPTGDPANTKFRDINWTLTNLSKEDFAFFEEGSKIVVSIDPLTSEQPSSPNQGK